MRLSILRNGSILLTISVFLFNFSTCSNSSGNCSSENVGSQSLSVDSKDFIVQNNATNLIFESSNGSQIAFNLEVEHRTNNRNCVQYVCEGFTDPYQQQPCKYFNTESYRNIYRDNSNTMIVEFVLSIENYEEETSKFYDLLTMHMSTIGTLSRGQKATYAHDTSIDLSSIYYVQEPLQFYTNLTIGGQTLSNVYVTTDNTNNKILFQKNTGLVALTISGVDYFRQ